ncbi:MAG: shikimate dehydrogenase [Clostridiales bacterium]|nr:shikimate dehydrogenase [Clostridiales bacterium]
MLNVQIKGDTRIYGVIGDPIAHTFSPEIHNSVFKALGENAVYIPLHVKLESLSEAVKGAAALGFKGLNVTLPHKINIIPHLTSLDSEAALIGAVNTVRFSEGEIKGYNTDIIGVEYTFKTRGLSLKGRTCLLLGAGGAADAVLCALLKAEAKKIYIANRTVEKAQALKERLNPHFNSEIIALSLSSAAELKGVDTVLNTTTLGFEGKTDLTPLPKAFFDSNDVEICFDAIYTPWQTRLLKEAEEAGASCINGFDMLIFQGAASEEIWQDRKFDYEFLKSLNSELKEHYKKSKGIKK